MKIPPRKPHFFKPILRGFKDGINIPIGFLKYLEGHEHIEHAILKRACKKWLVKVIGRRFEEGWKKFAEEHDLQFGHLLIFRHDGDMEFEVSIFGSSNCEREYPEYLQQEEEQEQEDIDEAAHAVEETSDDFEFKEKSSHSIESSDQVSSHSEAATRKRFDSTGKRKPNIKTSGKAFLNVEAAYKNMHLSHSHFICTIRPYCLTQHCLCIPKQFAQENGLSDRKCMIIVRDEQRSWTFSVYTSGKNTFIGSAWREFSITHCLKEGDRLMFEIVSSNGETPIFIFHDLSLKTSNMTTLISQVAASTSADANPHFISTIKPYALRFPVLYLPMAFAKSNGLLNRHELILVDKKQRPWSMQLGRIDNNHFGIKRGWPQFREANGVQVGDTYKFELTNNDTTPIVHFHCKYTGN